MLPYLQLTFLDRNMVKLSLWFEHSQALSKIEFRHPMLTEGRVAYRGKDSIALGSIYSFQWTAGIQAMAVLLLRTLAEEYIRPGSHAATAILVGESGSLAASLDYALSKQPNWLLDIFGTDASGVSLARKLFHRANPERRRAGPVQISVNRKQLPWNSIEVFYHHTSLRDADSLVNLAENIERAPRDQNSSRDLSHYINYSGNEESLVSIKTLKNRQLEPTQRPESLPSPLTLLQEALLPGFRQALVVEIKKLLQDMSAFSSRALNEVAREIATNPSFLHFAGNRSKEIMRITDVAQPSLRLGLTGSDKLTPAIFDQRDPFKISIPVIMLGPLFIAWYMKQIKGCNIEIDFAYAYGVELLQRMLAHDFEKEPDACVMGVAGAAKLIHAKKSKFELSMLLPGLGHKIIGPRISNGQKAGGQTYFFPLQDATTPRFCFDDLIRKKIVEKKRVGLQHTEPDEIALVMKSADPQARAIVWFPVCYLNTHFNRCECYGPSPFVKCEQEMFLFLNRDTCPKYKQRTMVELAFRNAWLELLENREAFELTIDSMIRDKQLLSCLLRSSGIHNLTLNSESFLREPACGQRPGSLPGQNATSLSISQALAPSEAARNSLTV